MFSHTYYELFNGESAKHKAARYIINNLISDPSQLKIEVSSKIGANTKNNKDNKAKVI